MAGTRRESEAGRSHAAFYDLAQEVRQHPFLCGFKGRRKTGRACVTGNLLGLFFGKYHLPEGQNQELGAQPPSSLLSP